MNKVRSLRALFAVVVLLVLAASAAGCGTATTTTSTAATTTTATSGSADGTVVVNGMVDAPGTFTIADLKTLKVETITADHPKLGSQEYTGVRMSVLFDTFKVQSGATAVVMGSRDGFMAEIAVADIEKTADAMLAIGDDGTLNGVMPGMTGKAWVKDVVSMEFK